MSGRLAASMRGLSTKKRENFFFFFISLVFIIGIGIGRTMLPRRKLVFHFHRLLLASPSSPFTTRLTSLSMHPFLPLSSNTTSSLFYTRFIGLPSSSPNLFTIRTFAWSSAANHESAVVGDADDFGDALGAPSSELADVGSELLKNAGDDGGGHQLSWYSPIRAVISLLDGYHDIAGLPWWVIIATSTLALRLTIFPILVLQLKKLKKVAEWMPKLPPPFPPPFSGGSFKDQYLLFRKKRKAVGCPTPLWVCASFAVQLPCFILWMASIRHMSLHDHPGFDMGGALWFQNLTDFPHGVLGLTFPSLIAGLHFINVQVSFRTSSFQHYPGVIGQLAKYYKVYLNLLTIPIFLVGFAIPQGSLVYWLTNSSLNLLQQFCLRDPFILKKLGIFAVNTQKPEVSKDEFQRLSFRLPPFKDPQVYQKLGIESNSVSPKENLCIDDLPPRELCSMGIQYLEADNYEKALPALRLASEKDPALECTASLAMGLFLLSKHSYIESSKHFERAVLKMNSEATNVIIASYGAGLSLIFQGRSHEGIEHLKRIAEMEVPESPLDRYCYGQGLVLLGVTLHNERQKNEALKYLRRAAVFDHTINNLVKVCESTEDQ